MGSRPTTQVTGYTYTAEQMSKQDVKVGQTWEGPASFVGTRKIEWIVVSEYIGSVWLRPTSSPDDARTNIQVMVRHMHNSPNWKLIKDVP